MTFMRFNLTAKSTPTSTAIPFPQIHPVINPLHLNTQNGKLLSDAEILEAEKHLENKHSFSCSVFSASCRAKLKVFKINGWLYVRYFGAKNYASLGHGCFGNVRIAQDLITGEFLAIKKQIIRVNETEEAVKEKQKEKNEYFQKNEAQVLEAFKLSHGTYLIKRTRATTYYTIMPLEHGLTLDIFLRRKIGTLTPSRYLLLMKKISLACKALQNKNMIHGDLKPTNILVDDFYQTKLIDYQTALPIGSNHTYLMNAPGFRAYETFACKQAPYPYTPETDMNALGIIYAEMIEATRKSKVVDKEYACDQWYRVKPRMPNLKNKIISDNHLCDTLTDYFLKMTDNNPKNRPSIDDAVNFFQTQYEATHDHGKILKIGIIDLIEFNAIFELNKKYAEKLALFNDKDLSYAKKSEYSREVDILVCQLSAAVKNVFYTLKKMDTLYFVDRENRPASDYHLIAQLFHDKSLSPCEKIFKPNCLASSTTGIIHSITQEHPWTNQDFNPAYFYITHKKLSREIEYLLTRHATCTISLDEDKKNTNNEIITAHVNACLEQLKPAQSVQLTV